MKQASILIIDDDPDFVTVVRDYLRMRKYEVTSALDVERAKRNLKDRSKPDAVLLDVMLGESSGIDLIPEIRAVDPDLPIIMLSSRSDTRVVVSAMKAGANDYVVKTAEPTELESKIAQALAMRGPKNTGSSETSSEILPGFVAANPDSRRLVQQIRQFALSNSPVLISGETGTGKRLIADLIHRLGPRSDQAFELVDCAAIPPDLVELQLFGQYDPEIPGKIEACDGGTLHISEICDAPAGAQIRLLRFLQSHEFERCGSTLTRRADVRLIVSTRKNVPQEITAGCFREDLFYRLNVLPMNVAPLRDRPEDIAALTLHFVRHLGRKHRKHFSEIADTALAKLRDYRWPGNVRELMNTVERAITLAREPRLTPADFSVGGSAVPPRPGATEPIQSVKDVEYRSLVAAITESGGNMTKAAQILGVSRDTLYRRMKRHNIRPKQI